MKIAFLGDESHKIDAVLTSLRNNGHIVNSYRMTRGKSANVNWRQIMEIDNIVAGSDLIITNSNVFEEVIVIAGKKYGKKVVGIYSYPSQITSALAYANCDNIDKLYDKLDYLAPVNRQAANDFQREIMLCQTKEELGVKYQNTIISLLSEKLDNMGYRTKIVNTPDIFSSVIENTALAIINDDYDKLAKAFFKSHNIPVICWNSDSSDNLFVMIVDKMNKIFDRINPASLRFEESPLLENDEEWTMTIDPENPAKARFESQNGDYFSILIKWVDSERLINGFDNDENELAQGEIQYTFSDISDTNFKMECDKIKVSMIKFNGEAVAGSIRIAIENEATQIEHCAIDSENYNSPDFEQSKEPDFELHKTSCLNGIGDFQNIFKNITGAKE